MKKKLTHSFQMEHSPRGAEGSFGLGRMNFGGGFSLEQEKVGTQDVYIGYYNKDGITLMPYCKDSGDAIDTGMGEFIPTGDKELRREVKINKLTEEQIQRDFNFASDTFRGKNIEFTIFTPVDGIPNVETESYSKVKDAIAPGLISKLTFDNTDGIETMTGFFAVGSLDNFCYIEDITGNEYIGVETLSCYGFAAKKETGMRSFSDFGLANAFQRPNPLRIRHSGLYGIMIEVASGEKRTIDIAFGWFKSGIVTLGKACSY